jgi:tetratricopeptide (TPR) repeat protein
MDFALVLLARGELAAAEPHLVRVLNAWRTAGAPTSRPLLYLARIHMEQGRLDQAERELEGIEETTLKTWGAGSWSHATVLTRLGDLRLAQGRTAEAQALFTRVRDEFKEEHLQMNRAYAMTTLLRMRIAAGDATAVAAARELIQQIESSRGRTDMPDEEAAAHMLLGVALMRAGDPAAAREHLERAVTLRERMDAAESPWLAQARLYLAQGLHRSGDHAGARRMLDLAAAAHREHAALAAQYRDLLAQTRALIAT